MQRWVRIRIATRPLLTAVFLLLNLLVGGVGKADAVNWSGALAEYTLQPGNQYYCGYSGGQYNWSSDLGLDPPSCNVVSPACGTYVTGFSDSCMSTASAGGIYADQKHKIWIAPAGSYTEFDALVIADLETYTDITNNGYGMTNECTVFFYVDLALPIGTTYYYKVVVDVAMIFPGIEGGGSVEVSTQGFGPGQGTIITTQQSGQFEHVGSRQVPPPGNVYGFHVGNGNHLLGGRGFAWRRVNAKARFYFSATPFSTIAVAEKSWQQVKELYR